MSTEVGDATPAVPAVKPKKTLPRGPQEGVQYPLKVVYCGVCSMPPEYCEFNSNYASCKEWLVKNLPEMFSQLETDSATTESGDQTGDGKKPRQKRGGKALLKPKKKETGEQIIKISRANRGKKKYVTFVQGLTTFDIDLKEATKFFSSRFACGSSISGGDEIIIQGDVKDDLYDVITEKWNQVDEDAIDDIGDVKR